MNPQPQDPRDGRRRNRRHRRGHADRGRRAGDGRCRRTQAIRAAVDKSRLSHRRRWRRRARSAAWISPAAGRHATIFACIAVQPPNVEDATRTALRYRISPRTMRIVVVLSNGLCEQRVAAIAGADRDDGRRDRRVGRVDAASRARYQRTAAGRLRARPPRWRERRRLRSTIRHPPHRGAPRSDRAGDA